MRLVRCAKALIIDADNNLLVLRRSSTHPYDAYKPDLPGGVINLGESFETGVVREISEETGLIINKDDVRLVYAATNQEDDKSITRALFVVNVLSVGPEVAISWEHDQFEWLNITTLSTTFRGFYGEAVKYIRLHNLWQTTLK